MVSVWGHIIAEHGCEEWIVLGCSDSWRGQTPTMSLYPPTPFNDQCFSKLHTLGSWMRCEPPSLPPSHHIILHYTVICSSMLGHLSKVCHDSTAAIYRFFSQSLLKLISVMVEVFIQLPLAVNVGRKTSRMKPSLFPAAVPVCVYVCVSISVCLCICCLCSILQTCILDSVTSSPPAE